MSSRLYVSAALLALFSSAVYGQQLSDADSGAYQNSCRAVEMTLKMREMHREPDDPPVEDDEFTAAGRACKRLEAALSSSKSDDLAQSAKELRPILALLGMRPTSEKEQLAALEKKSTRLSGEDLFDVLPDLAKRAFNASEVDRAEQYANQLLQMSDQYSKTWNYGNAMFYGNFVLGRVALRKGNLKDADRYLLAAGNTPGSPQLDSFGPNMSLAKELLEHGESEAVLQYLSLCKKFWEGGQEQLEHWSAEIRSGKTPDFSHQLNY